LWWAAAKSSLVLHPPTRLGFADGFRPHPPDPHRAPRHPRCLRQRPVAGTGAETLTYAVTATGSYYIIVDSYLPSEYGCYEFQVSVQ